MDTFFSTKTGGKSSRGNNFCQLFVTDKVFVYIFLMESKSEVLQAVSNLPKKSGPQRHHIRCRRLSKLQSIE